MIVFFGKLNWVRSSEPIWFQSTAWRKSYCSSLSNWTCEASLLKDFPTQKYKTFPVCTFILGENMTKASLESKWPATNLSIFSKLGQWNTKVFVKPFLLVPLYDVDFKSSVEELSIKGSAQFPRNEESLSYMLSKMLGHNATSHCWIESTAPSLTCLLDSK